MEISREVGSSEVLEIAGIQLDSKHYESNAGLDQSKERASQEQAERNKYEDLVKSTPNQDEEESDNSDEEVKYNGQNLDPVVSSISVSSRPLKKFENGDTYEGEWDTNGEFSGQGTYTYADGGKYQGQWLGGKEHGFGKEIYENNNEYCGEFKHGQRDGKGVYIFTNGESYEGEFKNGQYHGKGTIKYPNGDTYEGDWVDDQKHGKGILTSNGSIPFKYEGDFKDNEITGFGKHTFNNGDSYEGEYLNGLFHGKGKYTFQNGESFEGNWENNKCQESPDSTSSFNEKHGEIIYVDAEGNKSKHVFKNGVFQQKSFLSWLLCG